MIGRMPVLRGDDEIVLAFCDQPIDDRNDILTVRHGKVSAGAEAVLDIDEQEAFHGRSPIIPAAGSGRVRRLDLAFTISPGVTEKRGFRTINLLHNS